MKLTSKFRMAALAACVGVVPVLSAQDFDFDSQRGERQVWQNVPGKVVDHHGLVVNPTPREMTTDRSQQVNVAGGIKPGKGCGAYSADIARLGIATGGKGMKLDIALGEKPAAKAGVAAKSGAYRLTVGKKGANIAAFDDRGVYYALQTLRQLLESGDAADGTLPAIDINDSPTLKHRGVVEGFYGDPWSHEVRKSLIDYYGRNKLNTYVFGPKDDPYHSSPHWREPYPEAQARQIAELVDACRRNRVDFVWAIHPGKDIKWNEEDYQNLLRKFQMMYDLGVRGFAIHFDDIDGEGTNPYKQTEMLNRLTEDFVRAKGDVANLTVCPTDYSRLWASPRENGPLDIYGKTLAPEVEVFYTGDVVCSDLTHDTMNFFNTLIRRPGYFWWNYPVTDYCRNFLLQGPVYGLDPTMTADELVGLLSNPMQHGEASKLALYSVADYTWNPAAYNAIDSWERGLSDLMPDAADAYRTFAIHSADTRNGYRRDESWETPVFVYPAGTSGAISALRKEFSDIETAQSRIEAGCANAGLVGELRPWLVEFTKLGKRCNGVLDLIERVEMLSPDKFWKEYAGNLTTQTDTAAYSAHTSGSMRLQPFYEKNMQALGKKLYGRISKSEPVAPADTLVAAAFDADPFTGCRLSAPVRVEIVRQADPVLLLDTRQGALKVRCLGKNGEVLREDDYTEPYATVALAPETVALEMTGDAIVHEIVL